MNTPETDAELARARPAAEKYKNLLSEIAEGESQVSLAEKYGVTAGRICQQAHFLVWKKSRQARNPRLIKPPGIGLAGWLRENREGFGIPHP